MSTKLQLQKFEDMKSHLIFWLTLNNKKQIDFNDFFLYNSFLDLEVKENTVELGYNEIDGTEQMSSL